MRLRTKLVLSATALTSAIVLVLSAIFVGELLRQRIEQTASSNEVLAREVVLISRQAVQSSLRDHPPLQRTPEAITAAVIRAVKESGSLDDVMQAVVRYSPTVEDVTITDVNGLTLLSTDPDLVGQTMPSRVNLTMVRDESVLQQLRQVFGVPRVLDLRAPLDRNGRPFLIVHVGVRSTFVRASYEPWLRASLLFALLSAVGAMVAAGVLATAALQPIEEISRRLEHLAPDAAGEGDLPEPAPMPPPRRITGPLRISPGPQDAVLRMTRTIDRLGAKMRSREAGYTALQTNVNEMLDALRDGVLLFGPDGRASIISDSANYFLVATEQSRIGRPLSEIFPVETTLGAVVQVAYASGERSVTESVEMEDGREVKVSLDRIGAASGRTAGVLVRLRDMEYAAQLGQELEVSQRLAAVGRLTAGVGHEVKNPINAMVVHLELLRAKLGALGDRTAAAGAQRHVEILAGEMQRLDRVVQTLADFSRPMELHLSEQNVRDVLEAVMELTEAQMDANGVRMELQAAELLPVRMDAELMQQALLNLLLNGMQAMPGGGLVELRARRERGEVVIQIADEGEGIPEEVLPRIFDLYFTTKPKGSGIGLAMCYRIVQMHGGSLSVRSATAEQAAATGARQGTLVELRLPAGMGVEARRLARAEVHESRSAGEVL